MKSCNYNYLNHSVYLCLSYGYSMHFVLLSRVYTSATCCAATCCCAHCLLLSTKLLRGRTTCCGQQSTCCRQQATCCPQHVARPRNLLLRNMLRWCKRGFILTTTQCSNLNSCWTIVYRCIFHFRQYDFVRVFICGLGHFAMSKECRLIVFVGM